MKNLYLIEGQKNDIEKAKRYYFKAHDALISGKWLKAINYLNQSICIKPDYYPAFRDIAEIYHQYGDLQKAQEFIKKALEIKPDDAISLFIQGIIFLSKEDVRQAIEYFERSRKNGEFTWGLAYNLSLCNYILGNTGKSIRLLNYAIQKDPFQIKSYLLLAQIFINQNKMDAAKEMIKKAKKIKPADKQLDALISEIFNKKKD